MLVCDGCGKRVDSAYEHPGWMQVDGSITRIRTEHKTSFIQHDGRWPFDFCGMACLKIAFDKADEVA